MDDMCLLCLELWHESVDCIYVGSRQWEQCSIEDLIEQHFWPMESITAVSWICAPCWLIINEFHKFYVRVEEAHVDLAVMSENQRIETLHSVSQPEEPKNSTNDFEEHLDKELSKNIQSINIVINLDDLQKKDALKFVHSTQEYHEEYGKTAVITNSTSLEPSEVQQMLITQSVANEVNGENLETQNKEAGNPAQTAEFHDSYIIDQQQLLNIDGIQENLFSLIDNEDDINRIQGHQINPSTMGPNLNKSHLNCMKELQGCSDFQKERSTNEKELQMRFDSITELNAAAVADESINKKEVSITHVESKDEESIMDVEDILCSQQDPLNKDKITQNECKDTQVYKGAHTNLDDKRLNIKSDENPVPSQITPSAIAKSPEVNVEDIDEEPITDDENIPYRQQDPLNKYKVNRIGDANEDSQETHIHVEDANQNFTSDKTYVPNKSIIVERPLTDSDAENSSELFKTLGNTGKRDGKTHQNDDEFLLQNFKLICELCKASSESFRELCQHFDQVHKSTGYVKCCSKRFTRRNVLIAHVRSHSDPDKFKCHYCGKKLSDQRCLKLHVKHIHENRQDRPYVCNICGKTFALLSVLKNHRPTHMSEDERQFSCDECGKSFGSNVLLKNHVRSVHINKYAKICDICGKKWQSKEALERHKELTHEGVKPPPVSCDICGLRMANIRALKSHKKIKHPPGGNIDYHCDLCSKISGTLKAHERHVEYKHKMKRDHKCSICDKAFKKLYSLNEHMATHTKTPLFTCPHCPQTFNSNANMHTHRKRFHPMEWLEARRIKYSGKLPPNEKLPSTLHKHIGYVLPKDAQSDQ